MTINELNSRYGAPGRIVFKEGHAGYPNVVIANKYGSAEIAMLGANVLSYKPTGHSEVLFRPAKRDYNRGESIHGGVPVCWPQFGNRFSKTLPQHGFARIMPFTVKGTEYSEDMTEVTLSIRSDGETKKLWPHDFELEVKISVSMKLNISMMTKNIGDEPFEFSCGFHPYFLLRNRDDAVIKGLGGTKALDVVEAKEAVFDDEIVVDHALDHVFTMKMEPKHEYAILDNSLHRALAMVSAGNDMTVVWNCGEAVMKDFEPDDWKKYVCVEPVSDWPGGRTLAPGERHSLTAAIQATLAC